MDARIIKSRMLGWCENQRDNNIMWRTLPTANIKGIGKTVTLGQALFSFLRGRFFGTDKLKKIRVI